MSETIIGEPDSICYDPRCKITEHRHEAGSSVPEAARAAKWARAIATAADADACFDEPYEQDGSTSDQDDRDYFHRLATQVMAEADREIAAAVAEERATRRATQDAVHADLSDLLDALGMGTHARPDSPHAVMQQAIAEVRALAEERATAARRVEALEKALRSFADHGLNCDLTPTINCAAAATTYEHFRSYLVRLDDHVRDAARAALASPGEGE